MRIIQLVNFDWWVLLVAFLDVLSKCLGRFPGEKQDLYVPLALCKQGEDAIVQIVVGFGLLGMAKWAWILAVISVGLNVISGLVSMFSGGTFAFICGSLLLVIPVLVLIYMLTPGIRKAFDI